MPVLRVDDWVYVTYMEGRPCAQVIAFDDYGDPVVEHPLLPGLGPIILDSALWELAARYDDPLLFVGAYI